MPLYRIRLSCSHNPLRFTSRVVQLADLPAACLVAARRLDYTRSRTYVGKAYDTWHVFDADPASLRRLPLALGRVG